jgi:hypothetical protein
MARWVGGGPTRPRSPLMCVVKGPGSGVRRSSPASGDRTRKARRKADQAFRGPKSGRLSERCRLLQGGHDACILVERVEKATDNRSARSLCYPIWLTLILRCDRPVVGPSALRYAPRALGPTIVSTVPGPVLRSNGTRRRNRTPSPREGITKGIKVRVRTHTADRTRKL